MTYERKAAQILRKLGVNNSYIGFSYIAYGVTLNIHNPDLITYISKGLYVEIATKYHTTTGCVERDMRTVIHKIWNRGDRNLLNSIFGYELTQKPRNGEFIDAVSHYISNQYEKL